MSWAIWITGRSGSGRTTLATRVAEALQTWPVTVKVLDLAATAPRRAWAPDVALDYEESLHAEVRLHTHVPDLLNTVEEVLLLVRRLHHAATATVTPSERTLT
jgi:uridine kinase